MGILFHAGRRARFAAAGIVRLRSWTITSAARATAGALLLAGAAAAHGAAIGFEQALLLAEQHSAALAARRAAVDGAAQAGVAAGRLPDPRLAIGVENFPVSGPERWRWNGESMSMRRLGLMQDVPNAARRAAQRGSAEARTERERALLEAERLAVRRGAAAAWLGLHFAERKLALFAALERENRILQDTLGARLAAGTAAPSDALMARQEALDLADRRDELQAAVAQAAAQLRRWTGEGHDMATASELPTLGLDPARLTGGLERHAELLAYAPLVAMAQAERQEAAALRQGDWAWEIAYANRARAFGDMVSFQLSFELPVSRSTRQEPLVAARQKEVERLQAERADTQRRLRAEIDGQLAELQRLERALQRQQSEAWPLAQERAQVTLASYQAGRADLGAVLAARKNAAEAQLRSLDLQAQVMTLQAGLAFLIAE